MPSIDPATGQPIDDTPVTTTQAWDATNPTPTPMAQAPSVTPATDPTVTAAEASANQAGSINPTIASMASALTPQTVGTGATLLSGLQGSQAIKDANSTLQSGINDAKKTVADYAAPYTATGAAANQQLATGLQAGGQFNKPFTMVDAQNSDAEKYARTTGVDALQNSAIAKGGLLGTNSIAGIENFAAQNAAQYQNQAFNQNLQTNAQAMGGLENLSGTGANVATSAGGKVADLQTTGATAGMNATLGAVKNQNDAVANAIAAYKTLGPTATTSGALPKTVTDALAAAKAAGTDPIAAVQAAAKAAGLDPAQTAAALKAAGMQGMGAPGAGPQIPGQTPAQDAAAAAAETDSLAKRYPGATPEVAAANDKIAQEQGITPTGNQGTNIGDVNPATGGLIVPDSSTGLAIDSTTGTPVMPADSFNSWWDSIVAGNPTDFVTASSGTDPFAEFLSANPPATDVTAPIDIPAIDTPVIDTSTTDTSVPFDMSDYFI